MLFGTNKNKTDSLMGQAKINLTNRPNKVAKSLIKFVDEDLLRNSKNGYGYGSIYYQRFNYKVDEQVLDYMKDHYENQSFEVQVEYPSNSDNRYKTFTIRCD